MTWAAGKLLAIDTESSGVQVESDRIVTVCAAIVERGTVHYQRDWLIAVDVDIPAEASAVHGITTEHARANGRPAAQVIKEVAGAVKFAIGAGMPIVAFNACFDLTLIDRECSRWLGQDLAATCGGRQIGPVIDPFVIWKAVDRYRKGKRNLATACEAYGITLTDAHTATADAIAAVGVAVALAKAFPAIAQMTPAELHSEQIGWRREQCDSLREYFDRQGTAHDGVPGGWPLLPAAVAVQPSLVGGAA